MNQNEADINKKIKGIYVLKREDFETEEAYDDYLEEREGIIFSLVHGQNTQEAEAARDAFKHKNSRLIERRHAEQMEANRLTMSKVLPILVQAKFQTRSTSMSREKREMMSIMYSDINYRNEIEQREANWTENADVSVEAAGGFNVEWTREKAIKELNMSLLFKRA